MPGPLPAGSLPTAGDTQVIRRTTTQPCVASRPAAADGYSHSLDHMSHVNWLNHVAHQSSDRAVAKRRGMGSLCTSSFTSS